MLYFLHDFIIFLLILYFLMIIRLVIKLMLKSFNLFIINKNKKQFKRSHWFILHHRKYFECEYFRQLHASFSLWNSVNIWYIELIFFFNWIFIFHSTLEHKKNFGMRQHCRRFFFFFRFYNNEINEYFFKCQFACISVKYRNLLYVLWW